MNIFTGKKDVIIGVCGKISLLNISELDPSTEKCYGINFEGDGWIKRAKEFDGKDFYEIYVEGGINKLSIDTTLTTDVYLFEMNGNCVK